MSEEKKQKLKEYSRKKKNQEAKESNNKTNKLLSTIISFIVSNYPLQNIC